MKLIDLSGKKFGRLTVIERCGKTNHGAAKWKCKCDCGNETIVIGDELRNGNTMSCGCLSKELTSKRMAGKEPANKTHGMSGTKPYKEWSEMKRRCYNSKNKSYNNYGARGIKVCERWLNSFETFYSDVSKLPNFGKVGYSLNRIDNNGDYEPKNVEWANGVTQANNRRSNRKVLLNGEQFTISELSRKFNVPYKKLYKRIVKLKWNVNKAISTP